MCLSLFEKLLKNSSITSHTKKSTTACDVNKESKTTLINFHMVHSGVVTAKNIALFDTTLPIAEMTGAVTRHSTN